jgi:hypothetical protein
LLHNSPPQGEECFPFRFLLQPQADLVKKGVFPAASSSSSSCLRRAMASLSAFMIVSGTSALSLGDLRLQFLLELVELELDLLRGAALLVNHGNPLLEVNPGFHRTQYLVSFLF